MAISTNSQIKMLNDILNDNWGEYFQFRADVNNVSFDKELDVEIKITERLIQELNEYLMKTMKYNTIRYSGDCSGKFEANFIMHKQYSGYTQVSSIDNIIKDNK